jgi:hypothetical protein
MQNTLSFQRSNPLQAMTGVARAMALPHEFMAQRLPSFPALERTAVLGFNQPGTVAVGRATAPVIPTTRGLLMRQAAYPLWLETDQKDGWQYTVIYGDALIRANSVGNIQCDGSISSWYMGDYTPTGTTTGPRFTGCTATLPFSYPLVGIDHESGKREFVFVPKGAMCVLSLGATVVGSWFASDPAFYMDYQVWSSPGQTSLQTIQLGNYSATTVAVSSSFVAAFDQWIRPIAISQVGSSPVTSVSQLTTAVSVTNSVSAVGGSGTNNWHIYTIPNTSSKQLLFPFANPCEFATTPLPYYSTRLTAVAALFTNVTKIQNKEGTVVAGRLNPAATNVWRFDSTALVNLHPAEKQLLGLESGFYTFCPPSTDLADFWDYTLNTAAGADNAPVVRLDNSSLVNAFVFTDPDAGTSLAVNVDYHIEFRTTSALWPIGLSSMSLEALHGAQLSLTEVGFFFPNETHKEVLGKVMPKLGSALGSVASLIGIAHPLLGKAAKVGSIILSKKPTTAVKPTTADSSGWNGQKGKHQAAVTHSKDKKPKNKRGKKGKK